MKQRRSVPELIEDREECKRRIKASHLYTSGEAFTAVDAAKVMRKTASCASQYLKQMVQDRQLKVIKVSGTNYYRPEIPNLLSVMWTGERLNEILSKGVDTENKAWEDGASMAVCPDTRRETYPQ